MKTSKSFLALLVLISIVLSSFVLTGVTAFAKDFEWEYEIVNKEVHITGCVNKVKDVIIPEKIEGYPVTEVSAYTFSDEGYRVTSITIPKTVKVLGDFDFQCPFLGLSDDFEMYFVDEDNKYFSSEDGVLYNKNKTVLISVPANSPLRYYEYPDTVVETNVDAFDGCDSIESITISKNVRYLDGMDCGCFLSCDSLREIIVEKGNKNFSSDDDGVLYNEDKTVLVRFPPASPITYYSVPSYVKNVDWDAFHNCRNLIFINLGQITSLGQYAFNGCKNLATIEVPVTLQNIDNNDFSECDNLSRFLYEGTYDQWTKVSGNCEPEYLYCLGDDVETEETTKSKTPVVDKKDEIRTTETVVTESVDINEETEEETENTVQDKETVDTVAESTEDNGKALKIIIPVIAGVIVIVAIVVIVIKKKKK